MSDHIGVHRKSNGKWHGGRQVNNVDYYDDNCETEEDAIEVRKWLNKKKNREMLQRITIKKLSQ